MATDTSSPRTAAVMGPDGAQRQLAYTLEVNAPGFAQQGVPPAAGLGAEPGAGLAEEQPVPSSPATPQRVPQAERFVLSPDVADANDVKLKKLEAKIKELEAVITNFNSWIPTLMADQQKKKDQDDKEKDKDKDEDILKPMHPKDMKLPFEF